MLAAKLLLILLTLSLILTGCSANTTNEEINEPVVNNNYVTLCKQPDGTFKEVIGACNEK